MQELAVVACRKRRPIVVKLQTLGRGKQPLKSGTNTAEFGNLLPPKLAFFRILSTIITFTSAYVL
jgi:hypothetical protein